MGLLRTVMPCQETMSPAVACQVAWRQQRHKTRAHPEDDGETRGGTIAIALIRAQMKDDPLTIARTNPPHRSSKLRLVPLLKPLCLFSSTQLPLPLPAGQIHEAKVGRGRDIGIKAVKWETFIFSCLVVRLKIGSHLMSNFHTQ